MKMTKEIEASMRATEAELDVALSDPVLKARFDELDAKYTLCEQLEAVVKRESIASRLIAFPKRCKLNFSFSFGEGRSVECGELAFA